MGTETKIALTPEVTRDELERAARAVVLDYLRTAYIADDEAARAKLALEVLTLIWRPY